MSPPKTHVLNTWGPPWIAIRIFKIREVFRSLKLCLQQGSWGPVVFSFSLFLFSLLSFSWCEAFCFHNVNVTPHAPAGELLPLLKALESRAKIYLFSLPFFFFWCVCVLLVWDKSSFSPGWLELATTKNDLDLLTLLSLPFKSWDWRSALLPSDLISWVFAIVVGS